jgi:CheY-like chemotaxis protein
MTTILIVDDEEGFRHILHVILERAGYKTLLAVDAQEAQAIITATPPDLVILDDMMPGMSGSELCALLKADPVYQRMPIIMHSANSKLHNRQFVASIGADDVLLKPCSPRDIINAVSRFVASV